MSGPSPEKKLGIYIIKAETEKQAAEIASADPFTVAGDARYELIDWDVRQVLGVGPFTEADIKAQLSRGVTR